MTRHSTRERLDEALARIDDPKGEGARACLTVYRDAARAAAEAADARAKAGVTLGALDGAIVSIKDLFDVAGEVTRAGSRILAEEGTPAARDAVVVERLRAAGAVIVAKTNMTEFAFSGVGENPHHGTPGIPADRNRVPGGSSSGAAVAVADGMSEMSIGSDTGGSTRIPAALTGTVGFKPSKPRVPTDGVFPLSTTLDSIGPLAMTVQRCADADAVIAGEEAAPLPPPPVVPLPDPIPEPTPSPKEPPWPLEPLPWPLPEPEPSDEPLVPLVPESPPQPTRPTVAAQSAAQSETQRPVLAADPRRSPTQKPPLHGRHWMAITGKPLGATAGAMMFQKGGNAVDAAAAMN